MTIIVEDRSDKYDTKRTGLTLDEALEAAVWGYHVASPSIASNAYIHYEFNGWRIQFVHDGREGSSSGWLPNRDDQLAVWSIVPKPGEAEVERDKWGRPLIEWPIGKPAARDGWGKPVK